MALSKQSMAFSCRPRSERKKPRLYHACANRGSTSTARSACSSACSVRPHSQSAYASLRGVFGVLVDGECLLVGADRLVVLL
jgi:hypothetical protein